MTQWEMCRHAHQQFRAIMIVCFGSALVLTFVSIAVPIAHEFVIVMTMLGCHASTASMAYERFTRLQATIDMLKLHRGEEAL